MALALTTAACGEGSAPQTTGPVTGPATGPTATGGTGSTEPTGPTTTGPSGSPTSSESPPAEAELEDGRHFGYIRSVDVPALAIVFDLAYFLTGDEATEAAEEHGDEAPPPNDYYIVNDNPRVRTLGLAPDLELVLLDWNRCCDRTFEGQLEPFADAINGGDRVLVGDLVYENDGPFWVTVEGGAIVRIEEQFLP